MNTYEWQHTAQRSPGNEESHNCPHPLPWLMVWSGPPWTNSETCIRTPCQPHKGIDDAVLCLLQHAHSHLDVACGTERILFFSFLFVARVMAEKVLAKACTDLSMLWQPVCLIGNERDSQLSKCMMICSVGQLIIPHYRLSWSVQQSDLLSSHFKISMHGWSNLFHFFL